MADNDGWIEWAGGEMPVAEGATVEVRHRDGDVFVCAAGHDYAEDWGRVSVDEDGDIIAYRIVTTDA